MMKKLYNSIKNVHFMIENKKDSDILKSAD